MRNLNLKTFQMKYIFRISRIILLLILVPSCKEKPTPPTVSTTEASAISYTTATSGGIVTDEGGEAIISIGVCFSTSANPTISDSKTTQSGGIGAFTSSITLLTPGTMYYVRAYATNSAGTGYGNELSFSTIQVAVPVLTTTAITTITQTSAVSGGNITDDKGGSVIDRGVCWSTSQNPTVADSKTTNGIGIGGFASNLTGLTTGTKYYVRAYATNNAGTGYGEQFQFITLGDYTGQIGTVNDVDGNTYSTIGIGSQIWMAENLKTTKYNDGTLIPLVFDTYSWSDRFSSGYCWYNNDAVTYKVSYGALYNWYTVSSNKLCPIGWYVPTDEEWTTLETYLIAKGYNYDGTTTGNKIAKSLSSNSGWTSSTITGSVGNIDYPAKRNATSFSALPGGGRNSIGTFSYIGYGGEWWSATESTDVANAIWRFIYSSDSKLGRNSTRKNSGFSVRCVKHN
jgi:uncharacterized protein (TIGR02145 family)